MANVKGFFGKFFGRTIGDAASFAIGGSISRTIDPLLQQVENETWATAVTAGVSRPIGVGTLADGVAQGQLAHDVAVEQAAQTGWTAAQLDRLVDIANTGPGVAAAFMLWRRGELNESGFRRAAKRAAIEQEWIDALVKVFYLTLDPADLARAIHRGLIPDPGLLQGEQPGDGGKVPAYPVYKVDAVKEAEAAGYDKDHLGVMVGLQGNPMGAHEAAEAYFRGVLERDDYLRAISEGNTRNEWAAAILEQSRQIPTARDFIENALRGYTTLSDALAGAARHGMSAADATLIYQNSGRPMNLHQITTGLARGGKFKPEPGEITDPYMASIVEGSLKPAYYDLALANRYTLPGVSALRLLVTTGDLIEKDGETLLLQSGWEPTLAAKVAAGWAKRAKNTVKEATAANLRAEYEGLFIDRATLVKALTDLGYPTDDAEHLADLGDAARVKTYRDKVVTAIYKGYLAHQITDAQARVALSEDGIDPAAIDHLLTLWARELTLTRHELTQAQIVTAYKRAVLTFAQAASELQARGLTAADAGTLLGSSVTPLTDKEVTDAYDAGTISHDQAVAMLARSGHPDDEIAVILSGHGPTPPPPSA